MNHQFRTLFRFQLTMNPVVWIMAAAFFLPLLLTGMGSKSLDLLVPSQNLFFIGFLGVFMLAPEVFYSSTTAQTAYGSEFILTRAIDRNILARAKSACFYLVVLAMPIAILAFSLKASDLQVNSYSKVEQQECLDSIPGSAITKNHRGAVTISIPAGNRLIAAWHCWEAIISAVAVQLLFIGVLPLPYRKYILWTVYGLVLIGPLALLWFPLSKYFSGHDSLFISERLFFMFAAHQFVFWLGVFLAAVLAQLGWERRFVRLEW